MSLLPYINDPENFPLTLSEIELLEKLCNSQSKRLRKKGSGQIYMVPNDLRERMGLFDGVSSDAQEVDAEIVDSLVARKLLLKYHPWDILNTWPTYEYRPHEEAFKKFEELVALRAQVAVGTVTTERIKIELTFGDNRK